MKMWKFSWKIDILSISSDVKVLLYMYIHDTYNCDYLLHTTFRFYLIYFQLNTDCPSQFYVFYRKIT